MDAEKLLPTRGQLERQISQTLQSLYRNEFGCLPHKISCHLFGDRLAIVAQGVITNVEKILLSKSKLDLAVSIRSAIDEAFVRNMKTEISDILGVEIEDAIADSVLDTGYLGIIVFLKAQPEVRLSKNQMRQYGK